MGDIKDTWNKVTPNIIREAYIAARKNGASKRNALRDIKRKLNISNDK